MDWFWHQRLGHVPYHKMKSIPWLSHLISHKQSFICSICPMARQQRLSFPESHIHLTTPFQLIHIDIWGPYHTITYHGFRYFITLVDDFTRVTWTNLLSCKSNALTIIKAFTSMVKVHFNSSVQTFSYDNAFELGGSYEASVFFTENGILHQTTIPHTPQQNGVVERKHKHLLEISRALLFQSKLPTKYWGDCVLTTTYIINRLPSFVLNNSLPYEKLHGVSPTYDHMKSFGCLCFATTPKTRRDKFQSRANAYVFLGYSCGKKGYRLLNLSNHSIFFSRDDVLHEHIFPYFSSFSPSTFPYSPIDHVTPSPPVLFPSTSTSTYSLFLSLRSAPAPMSPFSPSAHPCPSPSTPSPPCLSYPVFSTSAPPIRKSTRVSHQPTYLKDYICSSASFPSVSDNSKVSTATLHLHEPQFYQQAASHPAWQEAMLKEFQALEANNTWDIIPFPPHKKHISCKWVYKIKQKSDGSIERYKARLVIRGDTQKKGLITLLLNAFFPWLPRRIGLSTNLM